MEAGKAHVFLCDDDRDIVEVTRLILEERYIVHVYYQCDQLVDEARRIKPAAVLLDLWMPGEGGEVVALKLKKDPVTAHIPVVLFSASNNLVKVASNTNADAYIAKPYNIDELFDVIERCISAATHESSRKN